MFRYLSKKQWILILISALLIIAGYFILPVSIPLILAFVTALFLNPAVRFFQFKFRINRKMSVTIVFLLFLVFLGLLGTFAVTRAVTQIVQLADNAPQYINQINNVLLDWEKHMASFSQSMPKEFVDKVTTEMMNAIDRTTTAISEKLQLSNIAAAAAKIPELLVSFLVYLIALFLFMLELPRLRDKMHDQFTEATSEKVKFMNARLSYVVFGFLKAQFLVSIVIFVVSLIGLLWIAPDVALIMSLIIWAIDFIPIIGSIVILGPWSVYMLIVGDIAIGTKLGLLAIVLLAIRRTVEPKVMGRHIGLSPLATLIAMYLGLQLIGLLGFILGPLVVIAFNSAKEAGIIRWNYKL
ncbi:sporulation integral membrane protein YtvI [Halobacillus litoralis]|uniref:Sporulation integral membrane protein YtvI n=1 Tax=Halobacillus litoralis TaxID=45668 RepID=A0A845F933_9BACI|nr:MULTISPECIES: sporulation integral membrane protein YtvI [Halobacillus]MEC3882686.1 sporulation integral membrane protein YtvI [Halobacillus sp. HZG1]MYL70842.1 sporulation integral membrane protein YtvI [Halobacillus litoralis]